MKVCINCHTENAPGAIFCSNCGMSLMGAPTRDEAVKVVKEGVTLEEVRQRRTQQPLTASGIVYLFGHQFARPWTLRAAVAAVARISLDPGNNRWRPVRVPYSGQKVWAGDLGLKLWESAFVSLAQGGYIDLQVERREIPLLSQDTVAINQVKGGDDLPLSLEKSIMEELTQAPEKRWLKGVVIRLTRYRGDWTSALRIARDALAEMRWLQRGASYRESVHGTPTEEATARLGAIAGEVETIKARLRTFATVNPYLHDRLLYDVEDGVYGRFAFSWLW